MPCVILDTNVLVVANGNASHASIECQIACIESLDTIRQSSIVVLDENDLIFNEYMHYASLSGHPGVGDAFLKWIFTNKHNPKYCRFVAITPDEQREFVEFPDDPDLATFDRSDRKFVAVAIVHERMYEEAATILNATDSDWWHVYTALARHGIRIRFLCDDQRQKWMEH